MHDLLIRRLRFRLRFVLNSKVAFIVEAVSLYFSLRPEYSLDSFSACPEGRCMEGREYENAISQPKFCPNRISKRILGPNFSVSSEVPVTQISFL